MRIMLSFLIIAGIFASSKGKSEGPLKVGDIAPGFTLPDAGGKMHSISDYKGKTVALYFYPKDDTPGCTAEACNLRDNFTELTDKGIVVLGVSFDSAESHKSFSEKHKLPFTLLADTDKKVADLYGAKGMLMAKRMTFLIGPDGKIIHVFDKVDTGNHAAEILRALGKE
jgi:thioredoxin-dependent peroxiredoxin